MVGETFGGGSYTRQSSVDYHIQSEPWRYECPHCGHSGHALRRRYKSANTVTRYKEVDHNGKAYIHKPNLSEAADFYCDDCQSPVDVPIDKKDV